MTLGPLEYLVIGFDGGTENELLYDGSVAREIGKVVENGTIRIVDLVFIARDPKGEAAVVEIDAKDDPRFASFAPLLEHRMGLFTPEDVATIVATIPTNAAALVLLFEHRWAEDIKAAMASKGAFLIGRAVIPPEVLEEVSAELEASASAPAIA